MSDLLVLQWLGVGVQSFNAGSSGPTDNIGGDIQAMRGRTTLFHGLPHRFIEQFGGKPVALSFYAPDPMTFREGFYYNTRENMLYKRFKAGKRYVWKSIGE